MDTLSRPEHWALAFTTAQQAAAAGDYVRADTTLMAYMRANPGTPEALDAVFWRGMLAIDPSNPQASATMAVAAFDDYLRGGSTLLRRQEAEVMRRLALRLPATAPAHGPRHAAVAGGEVAIERGDPRDEEIRKLKDELQKATEELERIRRRIATPPPVADSTRTPPPATPPPEGTDGAGTPRATTR
jgi:hypothetical protein